MSPKPPLSVHPSPDSLSLKLGSWFEAHATGRGVLAIPLVVLVLALAAAAKILLAV
jgi:hypothetical protein